MAANEIKTRQNVRIMSIPKGRKTDLAIIFQIYKYPWDESNRSDKMPLIFIRVGHKFQYIFFNKKMPGHHLAFTPWVRRP